MKIVAINDAILSQLDTLPEDVIFTWCENRASVKDKLALIHTRALTDALVDLLLKDPDAKVKAAVILELCPGKREASRMVMEETSAPVLAALASRPLSIKALTQLTQDKRTSVKVATISCSEKNGLSKNQKLRAEMLHWGMTHQLPKYARGGLDALFNELPIGELEKIGITAVTTAIRQGNHFSYTRLEDMLVSRYDWPELWDAALPGASTYLHSYLINLANKAQREGHSIPEKSRKLMEDWKQAESLELDPEPAADPYKLLKQIRDRELDVSDGIYALYASDLENEEVFDMVVSLAKEFNLCADDLVWWCGDRVRENPEKMAKLLVATYESQGWSKNSDDVEQLVDLVCEYAEQNHSCVDLIARKAVEWGHGREASAVLRTEWSRENPSKVPAALLAGGNRLTHPAWTWLIEAAFKAGGSSETLDAIDRLIPTWSGDCESLVIAVSDTIG